MKTLKRYMPNWPFPPYAFLPGQSVHPNKPGGHMFESAEPKGELIDFESPHKNQLLRFAVDLYNHGFYWESHVYLEALWNLHERQGTISDFLKALIKLGAAGVKLALNQVEAGIGHFERAHELFSEVLEKETRFYLGFDLEQLLEDIELKIMELKQDRRVDPHFEIHPSWPND